MKSQTILSLFLAIALFSCKREEPPQDQTFGLDAILVVASSQELPFNGYSRAYLRVLTGYGDNLTSSSLLYVDGKKLEDPVFIPDRLGTFRIRGVYRDLVSDEIEIRVVEPLNKKVLIESYTSRFCGACPWIGWRVDSLDKNHDRVIAYSIHGEDPMQIEGTEALQQYQYVSHRPSIRFDRGYVRNYFAMGEIKRLTDSIDYRLSFQPPLELKMESVLDQQNVQVDVFSKSYKPVGEDLYLTVVLVEDSVITSTQANYFSGATHWTGCPFVDLPNPLLNYVNHNVLRAFLSDPLGDPIAPLEVGTEQKLGSYQVPLSNDINPDKAFIIAFVHGRRDDVNISSVLNAQIVKSGDEVGF